MAFAGWAVKNDSGMPEKKKSISRSLGEFVGHIMRGARTQVDESGDEVVREEVNRTVEEEERDGVTLRRTTIEEVEFKRSRKQEKPSEPAEKPEQDGS